MLNDGIITTYCYLRFPLLQILYCVIITLMPKNSKKRFYKYLKGLKDFDHFH